MEQQQSNFDMAVQYLAETASTYAQTLDAVARAPFVQHVNACIRAIREAVNPQEQPPMVPLDLPDPTPPAKKGKE